MITQRQIAGQLGVSQGLVARALLDDPRVGEETRRRIKQAAQDLGYRRNGTSLALSGRRTYLIQLIVERSSNPYYGQIVMKMGRLLAESGYQMLVVDKHSAMQSVEKSTTPLWPVDGVICADCPEHLTKLRATKAMRKFPMIMLGNWRVPGVDCVGFDFTLGVKRAIDHLHNAGCRRIAMLFTEEEKQADSPRWLAYVEAVGSYGQKPEAIFCPDQDPNSARQAVKIYLEAGNRPDGIFCFNDLLALGASRGVRDAGLQIPEEIAVMGCDGIELTAYLETPLSTLALPIDEMCERAWDILQRRIEAPSTAVQSIWLTPQVIARASTNRPA